VKKPSVRSFKRYVILPCLVLVFGALEEVVVYKAQLIHNLHLRVAAAMAFFAFGISLIAFFFTPLFERILVRMHAATRREAGWWGELLFVALLLAAVYFLWYSIFAYGADALLPAKWRN